MVYLLKMVDLSMAMLNNQMVFIMARSSIIRGYKRYKHGNCPPITGI
jgi:hypothetical protein